MGQYSSGADTLVDETRYGLADIGKAHERLTSGQAVGKVVVEV